MKTVSFKLDDDIYYYLEKIAVNCGKKVVDLTEIIVLDFVNKYSVKMSSSGKKRKLIVDGKDVEKYRNIV